MKSVKNKKTKKNDAEDLFDCVAELCKIYKNMSKGSESTNLLIELEYKKDGTVMASIGSKESIASVIMHAE